MRKWRNLEAIAREATAWSLREWDSAPPKIAVLVLGKDWRKINVFQAFGDSGMRFWEKPEAKDYAGFPVGGQFLVSENPDVVNHMI